MIPNKRLLIAVAFAFLVLSFPVNADAMVGVFRQVVESARDFVQPFFKPRKDDRSEIIKEALQQNHSRDSSQFSNKKKLSEIAASADEPNVKGLQEEPTIKATKAFQCALENPTVKESIKEIVEKSSEEIVEKFIETLRNEIESFKPENCE